MSVQSQFVPNTLHQEHLKVSFQKPLRDVNVLHFTKAFRDALKPHKLSTFMCRTIEIH